MVPIHPKFFSLKKSWFSFLCINIFLICFAVASRADVQAVRYNPEIIAEIDLEISAATNERYLAVLRGLRWCVSFCDNEENFEFTFDNYVTMLDELTCNNPHSTLEKIVHKLIVKEFERSTSALPRIFAADPDGYESFLSILPIAYHHLVSKEPLEDFAFRHFAKIHPPERLRDFRRAEKRLDYDRLTDIIVMAAFIDMAYSWGIDKDFPLPRNYYPAIMERCAKIPFTANCHDGNYHDQNYYATHMILALTHYGQRPFIPSRISAGVLEYLSGQYQNVRFRTGDFDLFCEYLYCFRQAAIHETAFFDEGEKYVMSLQRCDGSWGTPEDFNGDPYDALHPTWTAITLLALGLH